MPTYNEAENISGIIKSIIELKLPLDVLVVDDDSPDGTSELVKKLQVDNSNLHLLTKTTDKGFAKAYISGMLWALEKGYETVIQMDADGSHQPKHLSDLLEAAKSSDYVIGSRWMLGGSVVNWPFKRLLLSKAGNLYARIMLRSKVRDITGGFKAINSELLKKMNVQDIKVQGYSFQIELYLRARKAGANVKETPIEFVEREHGVSKMSSAIVKEAMLFVTKKGLRLGS